MGCENRENLVNKFVGILDIVESSLKQMRARWCSVLLISVFMFVLYVLSTLLVNICSAFLFGPESIVGFVFSIALTCCVYSWVYLVWCVAGAQLVRGQALKLGAIWPSLGQSLRSMLFTGALAAIVLLILLGTGINCFIIEWIFPGLDDVFLEHSNLGLQVSAIYALVLILTWMTLCYSYALVPNLIVSGRNKVTRAMATSSRLMRGQRRSLYFADLVLILLLCLIPLGVGIALLSFSLSIDATVPSVFVAAIGFGLFVVGGGMGHVVVPVNHAVLFAYYDRIGALAEVEKTTEVDVSAAYQ